MTYCPFCKKDSYSHLEKCAYCGKDLIQDEVDRMFAEFCLACDTREKCKKAIKVV